MMHHRDAVAAAFDHIDAARSALEPGRNGVHVAALAGAQAHAMVAIALLLSLKERPMGEYVEVPA